MIRTTVPLAAALTAAALPAFTASAAAAPARHGHPITIDVSGEERNAVNAWSSPFLVLPGQTVNVMVEYRNSSASPAYDVRARVALPRGLALVGKHAYLRNGAHPSGWPLSAAALTHKGTQVAIGGGYAPGVNARILFSVKVPPARKLPCGTVPAWITAAVTVPGVGTTPARLLLRIRHTCPTITSGVAAPAVRGIG